MTTAHRTPGPASGAAPPVPWLLRLCLHLLVAVLLILAAVRAFNPDGGAPVAVMVVAIVVGLVYAAGPLTSAVQPGTRAAGLWLGVLLATWLVLLWLTPDAIWLAFAWFFLLLHLLSWRTGLIMVVLTAVAAVAGFAWHQPAFTPAMAIGPFLGAAVAVATVWGFQQLSTESERRRALIAELLQTRAELAAAEREQGVLAERARLAREIHDTLAQGLSSIQLLLLASGRRLAAHPELADVATHVEQARATAQENLGEARRLVAALAPADLQGGSLVGALRRLCATTTERTGLPVTFRLEGGPVALPTPVEVALLRIAQSALANTTRHAGATRAAVTLTVMDQQVALDVVDDGVGFDAAALTSAGADRPAPGPDGGFGLASMRSRAVELGGTLTVESTPGHGTALAVTFPIATERTDPATAAEQSGPATAVRPDDPRTATGPANPATAVGPGADHPSERPRP
ncbi:sensor histidine kinase [Occultella aeris]|uniref:Oxygen sensor histidine kinase NreB n=1 Tax=Occultella aeris TaxID=2761496 RepID=A0A7M4DEN5_9MICO|nr:sensor histidine kinase [Occultella aeris]VZO35378.1 Sensor histidine kinase LiaS [Occultella aeris]